jgi:hypothetical protein
LLGSCPKEESLSSEITDSKGLVVIFTTQSVAP